MTRRQLKLFYTQAQRREALRHAERLDALNICFNGQPSALAKAIREKANA